MIDVDILRVDVRTSGSRKYCVDILPIIIELLWNQIIEQGN